MKENSSSSAKAVDTSARDQDNQGVEIYQAEYEAGEAKLYRLASDQGHAAAQYKLGTCYETGRGVEKDAVEAVRLYRLAADQGHASAQCNLGFCYYTGKGVAKDAVEAAKLYRLAADQGDASAQTNLGMLYHEGGEVERDSSQAILLFARASTSNDRAQKILNLKLLGTSHEFSVDPSLSNNTPLSASEIIEVISANAIQARISNKNSHLIGDLVEVSQSRLSSEELLKIYSTLANTAHVDFARSKSCKMIADCWAKKLGQEIGIEGEELKEIQVSSRDANTIQCQLPSGIGTKSSSASASASSAFSAAVSAVTPSFLKSTAPKTSTLRAGLVGGEELFQERNAQLVSKAESGGIEFKEDREASNFSVKADARNLPQILPSIPSATRSAVSYSPPEFAASETFNPMFEVPSSKTGTTSSAALSLKSAEKDGKGK
jgi:TPR repeat protein